MMREVDEKPKRAVVAAVHHGELEARGGQKFQQLRALLKDISNV